MPINLTQEFTFETDDLNTFERMFTAVCPILFRLEPPGIPIHYGRPKGVQPDYPSHSAAWYLRLQGQVYPPSQPLHLFICAVGESDRGYDESIRCASYEELVATAMRAVKSASHEQFVALAGADGPFNGDQGDTVVGYRMHSATCEGSDLSLSLCHIFYHK